MNKSELTIGWATHQAVTHACQRWHYSASVPVPPLIKVGAWESGKFIGVVVFSRGASPNLLKPYGLSQTEGCELSRIALTTHVTPVSRIVAIAIRFLKKRCSAMRLIVSFADPNQGHYGGVYQAGGWVYTGASSSSCEYMHNGKKLHGRQVSSSGYAVQCNQTRKVPKISDCVRVRVPGKYRYLMPLDNEMRNQIEPLRKPYPKRAGGADSGTSDNQSEGGGANPTPALLTSGALDE